MDWVAEGISGREWIVGGGHKGTVSGVPLGVELCRGWFIKDLASALSALFVELLERFPILSFPRDKSVCATAVYDGCRCRWARELGVLGEDQEPVLLNERTIGNE